MSASIDIVDPSHPEPFLVAADPATSTQTEWPDGFRSGGAWAAIQTPGI